MVYCADCGSPRYLCRSVSLSKSQEHMKCSANSKEKDVCSAHYIRTAVLKEIVLNELRRMTDFVRGQEDEFVKAAMQNLLEKMMISELRMFIEAKEQKTADT
ncbi:MAG: zinc ribbon domain-containing protein [Oscillospiraceae bacterium]